MNESRLEEKKKQLQRAARSVSEKPADTDLKEIKNRHDQRVAELHEKCGRHKGEAQQAVDELKATIQRLKLKSEALK